MNARDHREGQDNKRLKISQKGTPDDFTDLNIFDALLM
jgi:hypothetical protein